MDAASRLSLAPVGTMEEPLVEKVEQNEPVRSLEENYDARSLLDICTGGVTDEAGRLKLDRVAPGSHRLEVLLESRGLVDAGEVLVHEGETASMELSLDPEAP